DNGILRVEVIVGCTECDMGFLRDITHGGLLEAALSKQTQRRSKNAGARLVRFTFGHLHLAGPCWAGQALGSVGLGVNPARFLRREKTNRLKKCMTPRTSRTMPSLSLTISIAWRILSTLPLALRYRAT